MLSSCRVGIYVIGSIYEKERIRGAKKR